SGPVLTVSLNRPEVRNAQTPAMWRALAAVGRAVEPDVRVVVVRGNGDSFSAGLDRAMLSPEGIEGETSFPELAALDDASFDAAVAEFQEAFAWLRDPRFVSVVAVQGHAVGAGFQLALACDLRVVTTDARFCMRETALGLVPDLGGTKPLVDAVGYGRALEICATSRWVAAPEAAELGLATIVVERGDLDAAVGDLADALTAPTHDSVTAVKALLQGADARTYEEQRAAERVAQADRMRVLVRRLTHT
ncbi:MAG: enoyl-CoA hydratase/isomerase family protein, partial [Nocardioidaceae bacterium]